MCSNANECSLLRCGADWCSHSGWGCRLLRIIPDAAPMTMKERARLFSRVYLEAERLGVLKCPFFDEARLDSLVEDSNFIASLRNSSENLQI